MTRLTFLRTIGILFWISVAVASYAAVRTTSDSGTEATGTSLLRYVAGPAASVRAIDPSSRLRLRDPVFFQSDDGSWSQIGYVESTEESGELTLSWYSRNVAPDQCRLIQYRNSGRLDDVIAIMLPPEKRLQIQERLAAAMAEHGDELSGAFVPLVQQSLRRSLPVVEEEFLAAVDRHRDEIDKMAGRWNDEVVRTHLIPLARREILPIVREHGEPKAEEIGRELWDRASLWRFTWRAVYDKSPLPKKDLVQEEWDRFVEVEAVPLFESRMDDIVVTLQRIVRDVAANPQVRTELSDVAGEIAADPEARELVRLILKETLIDNPRLREVWGSVWTSDDARRAMDMAGTRLEPVVRQIGDDLFGSQAEGIDPNFARVLRNQILGKDRRWIVASIETQRIDAMPMIELATGSMPYPIVYMADRNIGGSGAE